MPIASRETWDVLVVGAGMAGASVAAELAARRRVAVLEMEERPGVHSTGRSAALFDPGYGNATIRALTRASRSFLETPPADVSDRPLVAPRGVLTIAPAEGLARLGELEAELGSVCPGLERIGPAEARARVPILREGAVAGALFDPGAMDIDVDGLHQGFLRRLRQRGGLVVTSAAVTGLARDGAIWRVTTAAGVLSAPVLVNAAGAWADEVGRLAGAPRIGLRPLRRTALVIDAPPGVAVAGWPLVIDADETLYFKPDAGRLLVSPADETASPPCDARPDELDVAIAVERLGATCDIAVDHVSAKWAGLRSFVADRTPVVGADPAAPGLFWLAGQGGYGIQTAPALARLAAALLEGAPVPEDLAREGVSPAALAPARLRRVAP